MRVLYCLEVRIVRDNSRELNKFMGDCSSVLINPFDRNYRLIEVGRFRRIKKCISCIILFCAFRVIRECERGKDGNIVGVYPGTRTSIRRFERDDCCSR